MIITEVEVRRLYTYGQYKNVSFGYKATVTEDESPVDAKTELLNRIAEDWQDFIGNEDRLQEQQRLMREDEWQIQRKTEEIERLKVQIEGMVAFLEKHGVDVKAPDYHIPF